jgi:hypothetical protein
LEGAAPLRPYRALIKPEIRRAGSQHRPKIARTLPPLKISIGGKNAS